MRNLLIVIIGSLGLGGCKGGIPTSPPPESVDEQRKPGLFTGQKGYFEIMPRSAHEEMPTENQQRSSKTQENSPKRTSLEELAAS